MVWSLGEKLRKRAYHKTFAIIQEAETYIEARVNEASLYGGAKYESLIRI